MALGNSQNNSVPPELAPYYGHNRTGTIRRILGLLMALVAIFLLALLFRWSWHKLHNTGTAAKSTTQQVQQKAKDAGTKAKQQAQKATTPKSKSSNSSQSGTAKSQQTSTANSNSGTASNGTPAGSGTTNSTGSNSSSSGTTSSSSASAAGNSSATAASGSGASTAAGSTAQAPTTMPNTGPGSSLVAFFVTLVSATFGYQAYLRRKAAR